MQRSRLLLITLAVCAVTVSALTAVLPPAPARALPAKLRAAREKYPVIVDSRLDSCALCHNVPQYSFNAYGRAFRQAQEDFAAIEDLDSDGDGYTNIAEIEALTFPGDPADYPSVRPTAPPEDWYHVHLPWCGLQR